MSQSPGEPENLAEGTLISHLLELRTRLLRAVVAVAIVFAPLALFSNQLFTLDAHPLIEKLPEGTSIIATSVVSPFMTPLKLSLVAAIFVAMPYILFQIWAFVAPGLYRREKRFAVPLLVSSVILFYAGVAFAYYVVFPLMFAFFAAVTPEGVVMMTDIGEYLSFVLTLFLAFGVSFEVPIATVMLIGTGLVDVRKLQAARPYVFLGAFVLGMFLTPPDVISQTLLAVPMYALYEAGLVMARFLLPEKMKPVEEEA